MQHPFFCPLTIRRWEFSFLSCFLWIAARSIMLREMTALNCSATHSLRIRSFLFYAINVWLRLRFAAVDYRAVGFLIDFSPLWFDLSMPLKNPPRYSSLTTTKKGSHYQLLILFCIDAVSARLTVSRQSTGFCCTVIILNVVILKLTLILPIWSIDYWFHLGDIHEITCWFNRGRIHNAIDQRAEYKMKLLNN